MDRAVTIEHSKDKAERLKKIRALTGLSQAAFCEAVPVNLSTYVSWENARFGGLTKKGAEKIVEHLLSKTNIVCSLNWLYEGSGLGPSLLPIEQGENDIDHIEKEVALFQSISQHALTSRIENDSMLPELPPGAIVGGINKVQQPEKCVGKNCIVRTPDGTELIRQVIKGEQPNHFTLTASNLKSNGSHLVVQNTELVLIAPIIWIRVTE